jgi:hypothetical protein
VVGSAHATRASSAYEVNLLRCACVRACVRVRAHEDTGGQEEDGLGDDNEENVCNAPAQNAIVHDAHPVCEELSFLHGMCRQDDSAPLLRALHQIPHKPSIDLIVKEIAAST